MKALIVIPTYNEAENIRPLIQEIKTSVAHLSHEVHVLVVDDNSPDGTGKIVEDLSHTISDIFILNREKKMGLGTAYVAGFSWGLTRGYDVLIEMDADFSHHPKYLPQMLKNLEEYDVSIGSRYIPGGSTLNWGLGRKIISRAGSLYSRLILGANIRDFTGGFNGWRKDVLSAVKISTLRSDGYSFQIELKYRAYKKGFKIIEFPIIFEDRKVGYSKMNKKIIFEALKRVWSFRLCSKEINNSQ